MLRTLNVSEQSPSILILLGVAAAIVMGVLIGTQPIIISAGVILAVAFGVLLIMNPLAAFTVMLILAPLRTLVETESPFRLPLDIGQISFLALVFAWGIYRIARGERLLLEKSVVLLPLGIFFATVSLSVFSAASIGAWLSEWLKWGVVLALIVLVLNVQRYEWLLFGLVTAGVSNALVGLYIFLGGSGAG